MPIPSTADQFLCEVRDHQLVNESDLDWCVAACPSPAETDRPAALADRLVHAGLLTRFQADQVLGGRADSLSIAGYTVLRPESGHGSGTAFLCRDQSQRFIVLRELAQAKATDPETWQRFWQEAETAATLQDPKLARIFPVVSHDGAYYLPTEYVEGETLQSLVERSGPLPVRQALDYLRQMAWGIGYAHAAGVAHRELNPRNVQVDGTGSVKVLNLGLARFFLDEGEIIQNYDSVLGVADYLAPE